MPHALKLGLKGSSALFMRPLSCFTCKFIAVNLFIMYLLLYLFTVAFIIVLYFLFIVNIIIFICFILFIINLLINDLFY